MVRVRVRARARARVSRCTRTSSAVLGGGGTCAAVERGSTYRVRVRLGVEVGVEVGVGAGSRVGVRVRWSAAAPLDTARRARTTVACLAAQRAP